MKQLIYERYLEALKISRRKPSLEALTKIIKAHLSYVPFENISKLYYVKKYKAKSIPDFEKYVDGIVKYNFGGTCYSNNYYLNKLLKHLGYNVRLCGADMQTPDVHLVNIVEFNKKEYLVDVGYGAPFRHPIPLNLKTNYELNFGIDKYIIKPRDRRNFSEIQLIRDGIIKHGYILKPDARSISEFKKVIEKSMESTSTFLNKILLVRYCEKSSVKIDNFLLVEICESKVNKVMLQNKAELIGQIYLKFGIPKEISKESLTVIENLNTSWN